MQLVSKLALVFIFISLAGLPPEKNKNSSDRFVVPKLRNLNVAVIADSSSCEQLASYVLRKNNITPCSYREASVILAVVRSETIRPLAEKYRSIKDLRNDVECQLNLCGSYGHIYVFGVTKNLGATEIFHSRFKWKRYLDNL